MRVDSDEEARCLIVRAARLSWTVNFSNEVQRVTAPVVMDDLILANDSAISVGQGQICMPPQSVAIFRSS
jgi:hypothetical protein